MRPLHIEYETSKRVSDMKHKYIIDINSERVKVLYSGKVYIYKIDRSYEAKEISNIEEYLRE